MSEFNEMWGRIEDDLDMNATAMRRDRPYAGQPHTCTGQRGATEVRGVTFRDLRDCYIRAYIQCAGDQFPGLCEQAEKGERAQLCENDIYRIEDVDPMAVFQNMSCEIERLMGIYPNLPRLNCEEDS